MSNSFGSTFKYSIGKKLLVGLTGLFLVIFLLMHLLGNLLLFAGQEQFNAYAEFMGHNPIVRTLEIGLFAGIFGHIFLALSLSFQNDKARSVKYKVKAGNVNSSWFSRNMRATGIVVLIFLILHLVSFFMDARLGLDLNLGPVPSDLLHRGGELDMYTKVVSHFSVWWYSAFYLISMFLVAFHLNHGFQSAFQTLGWNHGKYNKLISGAGLVYAIVIPAAFAAMPVYFFIMTNF